MVKILIIYLFFRKYSFIPYKLINLCNMLIPLKRKFEKILDNLILSAMSIIIIFPQ